MVADTLTYADINPLVVQRGIRSVIGGLHLLNATAERLYKTVDALNELDLHQLVGCHCTGDESLAYLSTHLNCEVVQGQAGYRLDI